MYQILKGFFVFLCAFFASVSIAFGQDVGSNTIIRKVVSQQQDEFRASVKDAFIEYLTIMSGNSRVSELPQVAPMVAQADKFLLEFRYEPLADADLEIVSEFEQSQQAKWRLKLQFDHKAVETSLFKAGAPIWPLPRPGLMVWVAHESELGLRGVITQEDAEPLKSQLEGIASGRGIHLTFPVFDEKDQNVLSASALWGFFQEDIELATSRYQLKNSVAVRIYPETEGVWQYSGLMISPNGALPFAGSAESLDMAASNAVSDAINLMSETYSIQVDPNDQRDVVLNVAAVTNYDQLHYLMADINQILMVQDVRPLSLRRNDIQLKLKILGDEQLLKLMLANKPYLLETIKVDDQPVVTSDRFTNEREQISPVTTESVGVSTAMVDENSTEEKIEVMTQEGDQNQGAVQNQESVQNLDSVKDDVAVQNEDSVQSEGSVQNNDAGTESVAQSNVISLYYQYQNIQLTPDVSAEESSEENQLLIEE
ncbi:DUF2066 domain-containing protein [Litoribrevibacter albus]|nr:DUF2066 domain-containing protein [Litoribrevibacter albus]